MLQKAGILQDPLSMLRCEGRVKGTRRKLHVDLDEKMSWLFFRRRRGLFAQGQQRDLGRIQRLLERAGKRTDLILDLYEKGARRTYFAAVANLLRGRPADQRDVIFIDPDNGIEPAIDLHHGHLAAEQVREVWGAMRLKDLLVVYQDLAFGPQREAAHAATLATAIGVPAAEIQRHNCSNRVCFYQVEKKRGNAERDAMPE